MKMSLFLIRVLLILPICSLPTVAQDYTQFSLPKGAITRLGKGTLGEVQFSPDGSRLAVSTSVGIWFYDPDTGKALDLLPQTNCASTFAFTYSPDGTIIARAVDNSRVQLWDVPTKRRIVTLTKYGRRITSIAYSPDGTTIVSGNSDGGIRVWNVNTRQRMGTLRTGSGGVTSVAYSPDGTIIAAGKGWNFRTMRSTNRGEKDDTVRLWDAETGKHKATLTGHTDSIYSVSFSPDNTMIASASSDNTVRLWNVNTGETKVTLIGHTDSVNSVAYAPDGKTIATASSDETVRLWNATTGKHKATLTGHKDSVTWVTYSPHGNMIATASGGRYSDDNTVRLWNAETGETQAILTGHHRINAIVYASDGETLTYQQTNGVWSWDAKTSKHKATRIHKVKDTPTEYSRAGGVSAYSPDGNTVATVGSLHTVQLSDVRTGKRKATLKHTNYFDWIYMIITDREYGIEAMAFSPDGKTIVTGGGYYTNDEGMVYLWHTRTRKRKTIYKGHGYVSSVAFSPDGETIAAGNWENEVRLWHAGTGEEFQTIHTRHEGGVLSLMYSPDGTTIATGGGYDDNTVHLLDANTGTLKTTLKGHIGSVTSIVYSPDGDMIATGGRDGTVRLWETDIGKHTATFTGHTEVTAVVYSPDGRTLASRNTDGTVLLWEVTPTLRTE